MTGALRAESPDYLPASVRDGVAGTALLVCESSAGRSHHAARVLRAGWECVPAQDIERACWLATVRNFGLIVVVGSTHRWSRDVVERLRPATQAPFVVLTPDIATGQAQLLRIGADVALDVGCDSELFSAAVHAVVRRSPVAAPALRYLESDALQVDVWAQRATVNGQDVGLTPTEFAILQFLMARSQITVKHHEIIRAVWNWKYADERNALRLQITRLRRKLSDASLGRSEFIKLIRGVGYVFDKPVLEFADVQTVATSNPLREHTSQLLESTLRTLITSLVECAGRLKACTVLVERTLAEGMCDGAAVFVRRPGRNLLELAAQAGMPAAWQRAVDSGLPLDEHFLATDTFKTRQIHHFVDISKMANRFRPTVRLMREAEMQSPAQLSVPLIDQHGVWGQAGFVRRSDDPFTAQHCMVLESAAAVLGALFADEPADPTTV